MNLDEIKKCKWNVNGFCTKGYDPKVCKGLICFLKIHGENK
jgi:hypothetical protein